MFQLTHRRDTCRAFETLGTLTAVMVLVLFWPNPPLLRGMANYLPLHTALEVFGIAVAGLVFAIGWNSRLQRPSHNVLWVSVLFLGVALLDFSHTLSYLGMPDFVTASGPEKAIHFWLAARALAALALLGAAGLTWYPLPRPSRWFGLLGLLGLLLGVAALHWLFLFRPEVLPRTFMAGQGLTPFKLYVEYGLIAAYTLAALLFGWRLRYPHGPEACGLMVAAAAMAMSELFFTRYGDVSDIYNLTGHLYKVVAYVFLYRALFVETVQRPYLALQAAQQRQQATLNALPDLLFELDLDGNYLDTPTSHTDQLLATPQMLLGRNLRDVMPAQAAQTCLDALHQAHHNGVARGARIALDVPSGHRHFELSVARHGAPSADQPGAPPRFIVLSRDVTAIVAQEQALERAAQLNAARLELANAAPHLDDHALLRLALSQARQISGCPLAVGHLNTALDHQPQWLGLALADEPALTEPWHSAAPSAPWSAALGRRQTQQVNTDTLHPPLQRWLAVPLLDGDQVVAVLGLGNKATPFEDHDEALLHALAHSLWHALVRQRQAQLLQHQQAELDHFFSANLDLFCIADPDGHLRRVNGAWEQVTGYTSAHLEGRRFLDFIHPADRQATINALAQLPGNAGVVDFENRWIGLDGKVRHIEWRAKSAGDVFYASARDVTQRKAQDAAIEKLSAAVAQNPFPVIITDLQGRIEYVNDACSRSTGYSREELLGQNPSLFGSDKTPDAVYRAMWGQLNAGQPWRGELTNRRKDGTEYIESLLIYPVRNRAGKIVNYLAHKQDLTEQKASAERIRQLSHFDQLTGLPNRRLLQERYTQALARQAAPGQPLTVMAIDLDHFKAINDALGPASGDELLQTLAQRLQGQLREQDTLSRLAGDDFLLLLPDADQHQAAQVATQLLQALQTPVTLANQELIVGASIGVALYPNDGDTLEQLQMAAESAMYRAKQEGRNALRFFAPDMQRHTARTLALDHALKQALARQELHLVYQPQCTLDGQRVVGVEALLRWQSPQWGTVSPGEFVPMAEANGLIIPIGDWVLRTAAQQLRQWRDAGLTDLVVAVNLSALQFAQPGLVDTIRQIVDEAGVPPACLELELTEAVALKQPEMARQTIAAMAAAGFRLSIDDFGTGYSSMSYLKRFAVHQLKIDQSFVRELHTNPEDQAIVTAIIQMAHGLGLSAIAEGVETAEQREFLRQRGCDLMQGYLFSRPLPPEALATLLAAPTAAQ